MFENLNKVNKDGSAIQGNLGSSGVQASKTDDLISNRAMLSEYRQNGFIVLRNVFSESEVQQFRVECDRLLSDPVVDPKNLRTPFRMNSGRLPERIDPVIDISPMFDRAVHDERILEPLSVILGERAQLFKDKLIFKLPGTEGYPMHQDYAWWKHLVSNPDKILTATVAIDSANVDNGGVALWKGYHHKLVAERRNMNQDEIAQLSPEAQASIVLSPGDVLMFHSLAPHASGTNTAQVPRRSLYLTYSGESFGKLRQEYYEYYKARETAEGAPGSFFK